MLGSRVADAGTAIGASPERTQGAGALAPDITETVGAKYLVLIAEAVIEPDVELILIVYVPLIGR